MDIWSIIETTLIAAVFVYLAVRLQQSVQALRRLNAIDRHLDEATKLLHDAGALLAYKTPPMETIRAKLNVAGVILDDVHADLDQLSHKKGSRAKPKE